MGNNSDGLPLGIRNYVEEEFARVKQPSQSYLTLSELLQVQAHQDHPFDFRHLSVLFVADSSLDSRFSLADLLHFAEWVHYNLGWAQAYQFRSQLQARTLSIMIEQSEEKDVVGWFLRMLIEDKPVKTFKGKTYLKIEQLKLLFEVFNVRHQMDIQSFFFLMKRSSEDLGMQIEYLEEDEEYVEVTVCEEFLKCFLFGAMKTLKEVGYHK